MLLFSMVLVACSAAVQSQPRLLAFDNPVNAIVSAADGATYVGGSFGSIDNQMRSCLAAIDANDMPLPWNPNVNNRVSALAVAGGVVHAGGKFTSSGSLPLGRSLLLDRFVTVKAKGEGEIVH
jgi:hypothetical protein